jgi:putative polyketide hydroxylase
MQEVEVLIVGGGPVGLTASILLSQAGVRSLLVERHPGTSVHPKARAINARSMELYRQSGVEDAIRAAGIPHHHTGMIIWAHTLAGEEIERRIPWRATSQSGAVSPVRNCLCAQDYLEPVLRTFAEQQGLGELYFSTEAIAFAPEKDGVVVTLLDRASGEKRQVRAAYVIAADGAQSRVRRQLGVRMIGREDVYDSVNILLNADLTPWTAHRPAGLYFIENQKIRGTFLTINATDRWGFLMNALGPFGYTAQDFTPERSVEFVRIAAGVPDLEVKILGIVPWTASALVAERYVHDRIFLAGDAAHEMPPTGGFGFNTGVQDVHNLVWKLAAVLRGVAAPSLLETYHDERQPVGQAITEQSLANAASMGRLEQTKKNASARPEYLNEQGMIFGANYASRAVVPDGTDAPQVANAVTDYTPSARPGGRAPHVWFERDGERVSTIDLVGRGFSLLTASRGQAWKEAASEVAGKVRLPLTSAAIHAVEFGAAYDIDDDGAVLVRPDGYVAWRSRTMTRDPSSTLREAMTSILGLNG